jgi:hypothetical protein
MTASSSLELPIISKGHSASEFADKHQSAVLGGEIPSPFLLTYLNITFQTSHLGHGLPFGLGIMPSQTAEDNSMEHRIQ